MAGGVSATQTSFRALLLNNSLVPALPVSEVVFADRKQNSKHMTGWRGERGEKEEGERGPDTCELG